MLGGALTHPQIPVHLWKGASSLGWAETHKRTYLLPYAVGLAYLQGKRGSSGEAEKSLDAELKGPGQSTGSATSSPRAQFLICKIGAMVLLHINITSKH
jgi:hypothetical protein